MATSAAAKGVPGVHGAVQAVAWTVEVGAHQPSCLRVGLLGNKMQRPSRNITSLVVSTVGS